MKLTNITPNQYRCVKETCPAIYTACGGSHSSCPTVIAKDDTYVIVGKMTDGLQEELRGKVGPDEAVIEIPRAFVDEAVNSGLHRTCEFMAEEHNRIVAENAELQKRIAELEAALKPIMQYLEKREAMPLNNLGNGVHRIHALTEHEAEITMDDLRSIRAVLSPEKPEDQVHDGEYSIPD
jgi:hypothetical protein